MSDSEPTREEVEDALFETLAALADLNERLTGGAKQSGVPAEQVVEEVWRAYDLEDADETFRRTEHERSGGGSPQEFAVDERREL